VTVLPAAAILPGEILMHLNRIQGCLLILFAAATASAQTDALPVTPPPMKMGLWETTITSQMTGFQLPPDVVAKLQAMGRQVPGGPRTVVTQSCLTPTQWQKDFEQINKPQNSECTTSKREADTHNFAFDISCKSQRGMIMNGHWEVHYVDDAHSHGSGHMAADSTGPNGQPFSMDMTIDAHYVGADCGDIQPGTPKILNSPTQP
jgi:hypothetical protein